MCIKMQTAECAMLLECAHANKYKDDYFGVLGYLFVLESFTLGRSTPAPTPASGNKAQVGQAVSLGLGSRSSKGSSIKAGP